MCVGEDIMGKVVFNIVETDYDVSKDEEKYQKFRKDYLENLSVGVCRLQEQYGLTSYRREKFINRIQKLTPEEYELITSWR